MSAHMSVWNIWLTDEQSEKFHNNESPFDTQAILAELDIKIRSEKDKDVFAKMFDLSGALDEPLMFEALWALQNSDGAEDKAFLEPFYEAVKEAHKIAIDDIAISLPNNNEVTSISIPGYREYITGGLTFGDDPTDTYGLWYHHLADTEDSEYPYPGWLDEKLSVVPFKEVV